jgi:HEAT repeat protein
MEPPDAEGLALVGRLNHLHEIFRVRAEILSRGEEIVEPLAALLLSEPSTFPEPRVAAAECLGAIGGDKAVDALIRVLDHHDLETLGQVQRFAEDAVRNVAARRLARFASPKVCDSLLSVVQRNHLIGAGQALAHVGDTRAILYLIECLEDDYKKEKATVACVSSVKAAVSDLCGAVRRSLSSAPDWRLVGGAAQTVLGDTEVEYLRELSSGGIPRSLFAPRAKAAPVAEEAGR